MIHILLLPTYCLLATFALWVDFLSVMALKAARDADQLPKALEPYAKVWLVLSLLFDCFYNIFIASVMWRDLPRELLFTSRLERYKYGHWTRRPVRFAGKWHLAHTFIEADTSDWRYAEASYWCATFLDPFEKDCHCKQPNP